MPGNQAVPPFCSVIVPTIGRDTLERAVRSVLIQALDPGAVEVIVVNDSGEPLPPAAWQRPGLTTVVTTNRRERSVARNAGAALARGEYLCFLDDDDWLLAGALEELEALARRSSGAAWVYGGLRIVDDAGRILGEANSGLTGNCFVQVLGGAWVPLQASLIRADAFFRVGGFDPFICGTEDLDLCRRIALRGDFANTPATVACLFRGPTWQTSTNYQRAGEDTRRSRNQVLAEPGAFARLRASLHGVPEPAYWHGRLMRACSSTVGVNLRGGQLAAATARILVAVASLVEANRHVLSRQYWEGVKAHHVPGTLHFIVQAYERRAAGPPDMTGDRPLRPR